MTRESLRGATPGTGVGLGRMWGKALSTLQGTASILTENRLAPSLSFKEVGLGGNEVSGCWLLGIAAMSWAGMAQTQVPGVMVWAPWYPPVLDPGLDHSVSSLYLQTKQLWVTVWLLSPPPSTEALSGITAKHHMEI